MEATVYGELAVGPLRNLQYSGELDLETNNGNLAS